MDGQLRTHMLQCLEPDAAQADPELLAAAVKLACSALLHHPSLVDVLFLPTALAAPGPEGKVICHLFCLLSGLFYLETASDQHVVCERHAGLQCTQHLIRASSTA